MMNSVRIIHTSDLHLDCRLNSFSLEKSKLRRQELKSSFEYIFKVYNNADIVLIPGDIFDNSSFSKSTVSLLINIFKTYPDTVFFICGGNHDWVGSPAMNALSEKLPDNVVLFSSKAEYMELDDIKVRVYGMSFSDKVHYSSMIDEFEVIDDDYINILMLHGDITSEGSDSKYNPISVRQLTECGFDYVALGHTHEFSGIKKVGKTHYAYCGSHEGHGFDECGPKGIIYGTVSKGDCELRFHKTCVREYITLETDVTSAATFEQIVSMVQQNVVKNNIYKIVLKGILNDNITIDEDILIASVDAFYIKIDNQTRRNYNLDELSTLKNLKGFVAKEVLYELETSDDSDIDAICASSDYLFELLENGGAR